MAAPAKTLLVIDIGRPFIGWTAVIDGAAVCVLTSAVYTDPAVEAGARAFMQQRHIDCGTCPVDCPLSGLVRTV